MCIFLILQMRSESKLDHELLAITSEADDSARPTTSLFTTTTTTTTTTAAATATSSANDSTQGTVMECALTICAGVLLFVVGHVVGPRFAPVSDKTAVKPVS